MAAGLEPGPIIDTHAFAFSPIFLRENALPEGLDGTFDSLAQDMHRAGVAKTIATVSVTRQDDFFESVARGLHRHPTQIAAQLHLAPNHPDWTAANLQAAVGDPRIAGARAALSLFKMHPVDERLEKVWDVCERGRLPVQFVVDASKYADPSTIAILARERPRLTVLLSITQGRHRAGLPPLARFGSVYFQLSGLLDGEIAEGEPALLRWAARHLPAERLVFGSDRLGREASYFAKVNALRGLGPALFDCVARVNPLEIYGHRLPAWRAPTSKP